MKRRFLLGVILAAGVWGLTGCVSTLDGRHRAAVPFVNDTLVTLYERTPKECWTATRDVLAHRGQIASEDFQRNTIEAAVAQRRVWVRVEPFDQPPRQVTRVSIQVRGKAGGTDMDLAAQIQTEIAVRLATDNLAPATTTGTAR